MRLGMIHEANVIAQEQDALKDRVRQVSSQWKEKVEAWTNQEVMKLKRALNEAQNNNIKESIRVYNRHNPNPNPNWVFCVDGA